GPAAARGSEASSRLWTHAERPGPGRGSGPAGSGCSHACRAAPSRSPSGTAAGAGAPEPEPQVPRAQCEPGAAGRPPAFSSAGSLLGTDLERARGLGRAARHTVGSPHLEQVGPWLEPIGLERDEERPGAVALLVGPPQHLNV